MTVVLRHRCATAEEARRLARAVAADNPTHVRVVAEGRELAIALDPTGPASARATLDDLLACLQTAQRTGEEAAAPSRSRRTG